MLLYLFKLNNYIKDSGKFKHFLKSIYQEYIVFINLKSKSIRNGITNDVMKIYVQYYKGPHKLSSNEHSLVVIFSTRFKQYSICFLLFRTRAWPDKS